MDNEKMEISVPVICTRGIIVFPNQDVLIEVGREKSVNAIDESTTYFDGHVWVVSQKDVLVDEPGEDDLFKFGT
ncbi:MAG: hypothetical protein JXK92_05035, partial [Erysipelotrichaceae bacterium]|nr:hypothetical protein [Erysipelotrichaceae bacterium]